jgi:hypothetical protein
VIVGNHCGRSLLVGHFNLKEGRCRKGDPAGRGSDNHRTSSYPKTVLTEDGAVDLDVPRDRKTLAILEVVKVRRHVDKINRLESLA